ncbi:MAG: hypothetical protein ACREBQ_13345 [Nitrososphaerales archaeon]
MNKEILEFLPEPSIFFTIRNAMDEDSSSAKHVGIQTSFAILPTLLRLTNVTYVLVPLIILPFP